MRAGPKVNTKKVRLAESIVEQWDQGESIAFIARSLECGQNTVRRLLDERRPGERLERAAPKVEVTRECSGCHEVFPLEDFPPRTDREGKRHARCYACLRDWYRVWQRANPERNREGVRRRRARLRASRTEAYRDHEIYARDHGLCWFCHLPIDISLRYPDPKSLVVHHLHPIAKTGPDIVKNVAIAHYDCNHRWKDRYDSPFTTWVVAPLPIPKAREVVKKHHYLHRVPPMSYTFGLYDEQDLLRGVVAFGSPTSLRILRSVTDQENIRVLELNRLWIDDEAPFGAGSWFISRALKLLPGAIVISYADTAIIDPRYQTTHSGSVYRACSFNYSGTSKPTYEWRLPGGSRNVGKHTEGSVPVPVSSKARYWTVVGSRTDKRVHRAACKWMTLPYGMI